MKVLLRVLLLSVCSFSFLPALYAQEEEFSSALDSARAAED